MSGKLGVFCLEGDWSTDLTAPPVSVRSLLDLMHASGQVKGVHRNVGTVSELEHYARIWLDQKRYQWYRLGWLAFHGSPGRVHIGRRKLKLEQLAELLGEHACAGRTIYLGSCGTVDVEQEDLAEFRGQVGARAVCGYTKPVDWMEAAAFELLLLRTLADYKQLPAAFRSLGRNYGGLVDRVGFHSDPPWAAEVVA